MPIHPYLADRFPLIAGIESATEWRADQDKAARVEAFRAHNAPYELPKVEVAAFDIPGPHGPIPLRTYRAETARRDAPGLVWLHGGGFSGGDLDMTEAHVVGAELAARASSLVVSVGYRLAVDGVRYPVPLDDAFAAWQWVADHAAQLGVAPERTSLGGASAGANLALSAALRARSKQEHLAPHALLLAYPVVHFPVPALGDDVYPEMLRIPGMLRFLPSRNAEIFRNYVGRISNLPLEVVPGHGDLCGLAPTWVIVAEYDDLRPSGELLVAQLREAGVSAELYLARGMLHGHLNIPPIAALPEVGRSLELLARCL